MKTFFSARCLTLFSLLALCGAACITTSLWRAHAANAANQAQIMTETQKLFDSAPRRLVSFGRVVVVDGDTLAVSAPDDNTSPDGETDGAVSVYIRNGARWELQQKLYYVNNHLNDGFGRGLALSGDTIVVGAAGVDVNVSGPLDPDTNEGAAVVFTRSNGRWTQQQVLRADDAQPNDYFGQTVAMAGDTIAVTTLTSNRGRGLYLFKRNGTIWTQQQPRLSTVGHVALNSDTLAVPFYGGFAEDHVKIYTRNGNVWVLRQELRADPSNSATGFGASVALSEDHLVVGATSESLTPGGIGEGAVYVFGRSGAGWVRKQKLAVEDRANNDRFGVSTGVSGNKLVVGTLYSDDSPRTTAGAAYVFSYNGTSWTQQAQLGPSDGVKGDRFAQSVAISGNTVLVGATFNGQVRTPIIYIPGAAYVYSLAAPARPVTNVSAATFAGNAFAPESIVAAFGTGLAMNTQSAAGQLPTTLAGTTVKIKDSAGVERMAPLFFVSPTQLNYQIPAGVAQGAASVTVTSGDGAVSAANVQINPVAPGLFTADASGRGLPAAVILRVQVNGTQSYETIARYDTTQGRLVPVPVDLDAETDQVFLILFGTGARHRSSLSGVTANLGGLNAQVSFVGAQEDFAGLDQINLRLTRQLIGRGEIDLGVIVDGQAANPVKLWIK